MFEINCWYWTSVLSNELCEAIINEGDKLVSIDGKIGKDSSYDKFVRETNISFFESGHWIESLCLHYANIANTKANWNLDIRYIQNVQYARYFPDQHYSYHKDDTIKSNQNEMRKLSVMLQITDPSLYQGGDFSIETENEEYKIMNEIRPRGSVIVFPSVVKHSVLPITKGVRHSIVSWIVGPNFR